MSIKNAIYKLNILLCLLGIIGLAYANAGDSSWNKYKEATILFSQKGSSDEVLSLCKVALEEADDPMLRARISLLKADVFVRQNKLQDAHRTLAELYNRADRFPETMQDEARLRDGRLYVQENQPERAIAQFKAVAAATANSMLRQEARLALAWQYADAGQWQHCDSLVSNIVSEQKAYATDERILALRARQNMANGDPGAATQLLESGQSKTALTYLALAYELSDKPIMAVGVYKKLHDLFPDSPEAETALFQGGEVFMRADDWLAAEAQFNRLMQQYPDSRYKKIVDFRLGWIYLNLKQYDRALTAFRSAATPENQSYILFMEAEGLRKMGEEQPAKLQEALLKYNKVNALYPHSPLAALATIRSAMTLLQKGDSLNANVSLRQFLSLHPKDDLAPAATFLLATHGKNGRGNDYFRDILQKYPDGIIFDAALAALQKQDYERGAYQNVINRKAAFHTESGKEPGNYHQRLHHLLLAESAYYLRQTDLARKEYSLVTAATDDDLSQKAALGMAWCLLQTDEMEKAAAAFAGLQNQYSGENQVRASFGLATTYFRMKRYEEAIQTYPLVHAEGEKLEALIAKSQYRIGESYYRLEYYAQAIEMWETLAAKYPESELAPQALYMVGDTYFRANHFEEAIAAHQNIMANYASSPEAPKSLLQLAQCEYNSGQYDPAIADFERFLTEYPAHERRKDALDGVQLCYYQLGQTEQATEALEKIIARSPNELLSADARYQLAINYLNEEKYDQAIQTFKEILTLFPGTSYATDAQFALAKTQAQKGDFQASNQELSRFVQYFADSPQVPEAIFNLGVGYFNLESYLSAADNFKQVLEQNPGSEFYAAALVNLGWCYNRLGESQEALVYFSRYLQEFPQAEDASKVTLQVANIKAESGDTTEALATFKKLQKSQDAAVATEAAYNLGMTYLAMQKQPAAIDAFRFAVKRGNGDDFYRISALSQLAALYESQQEWENAVAAYQQLVESTTDESWVAAAQERIEALKSMLSKSTAQVQIKN